MTENSLDPLGSTELKPGKTGRPTTTGSRISPRNRKHDVQKQASYVIADEATEAFIRRTLCSHNALATNASGDKGRVTPRPIDELLPPLTSSNEIDLQLYAIIAVILKEFVFPWYSKITPDHVFIDEVIQIIAHCTRALEQRFRKVDLEALVLDEIPHLIGCHIDAYRTAQQTSRYNALATEARAIYHTLNPHPALFPVPTKSDPMSVLQQRQNETQWRQLLVQCLLAVLLPTEDLENGCLRALVAEIFSEMILGGSISEKACEGWMLWESVIRIVEVLQPRSENEPATNRNPGQTGQSEQSEQPEQSKQRGEAAKAGNPRPAQPLGSSGGGGGGGGGGVGSGGGGAGGGWVADIFWLVLQYLFLAYHTLRAAIVSLAMSPSLPSRMVIGPGAGLPMDSDAQSPVPSKEELGVHAKNRRRPKRAILSMRAWSCCSLLLELEVRMPWVTGFAALLHWGATAGPGRVGDTDGPLDRLLSHQIQTALVNPSLLPPLLRNVRAAVFPNNGLGPPRIPPTPEEAQAIKCRCAQVVVDAIPAAIARILFATPDKVEMRRQVREWLAVLDDVYMNKWLIFSIIELLLVRLIPELGEKGVVDLMGERLG